jgi:hypothetical protein
MARGEDSAEQQPGERVVVAVAALTSASNSPIPIQIPARMSIAVVADMSAHFQPNRRRGGSAPAEAIDPVTAANRPTGS